LAGRDYYDYLDATFSANYLQPGKFTDAELSFEVPQATAIDKLKLAGVSNVVYITFPRL